MKEEELKGKTLSPDDPAIQALTDGSERQRLRNNGWTNEQILLSEQREQALFLERIKKGEIEPPKLKSNSVVKDLARRMRLATRFDHGHRDEESMRSMMKHVDPQTEALERLYQEEGYKALQKRWERNQRRRR